MSIDDNESGLYSKTKIEFAETINRIDKACSSCNPLSMISCVTSCKIWKLKNELRELHKRTREKDFTTSLLNTIKNKRRLQVLDLVCTGLHSISSLQDGLQKQGYRHSQNTIHEEYVNPLTKNNLVKVDSETYHPTLFGAKLNELIRNHSRIETVLPPHSDCNEERVLSSLRNGPKTYEDLRKVIPPVNLARAIGRLQKARLIQTNRENDYVFFFRTKRNPAMEQLSPTEKRIYCNISETGTSAKKIAEKNRISVRRAYKYLRRLKGKKMVFARKKPKHHTLTANGFQAATTLKEICDLADQISAATLQFATTQYASQPEIENASKPKSPRSNVAIPVAIIRYAEGK